MYPDYNAMVNEFIRPVVSLFLFVFLILGWVTAFMLMKENTLLKIKLGKEDEKVKEGFKIWILRKSASIVLPLYSVKTFLQERQFLPLLKLVVKKRSKILKLAFRIAIVTSIISNVFGINSSHTN
jgi:hypothetical protein